MFKVKLILALAGLAMVGASQIYLKGIETGIARADEESFQTYVYFAKAMQAEVREMKKAPAKDVFAAAGF